MPEQPSTSERNEESSGRSKPTSPLKENTVDNAGKSKDENSEQADKQQTVVTVFPIINVHVPKQDDQTTITANRWARRGVIVNGILAFFTVIAVIISYCATRTAQNALRHQESQDAANAIRDSANDTAARMRDRNTYDIAKKSLDAQINSVKEAQKEFEAQLDPFIEFADPDIVTFSPGRPIDIIYYIKNVTAQTVKADSSEVALQIVPRGIYNDFIKHPFKYVKFDGLKKDIEFFNKETPTKRSLYYENPVLSNEEYQGFKNGQLFLFICGNIRYTNIRNSLKKNYAFVVQLYVEDKVSNRPTGKTHFTFVVDDNF